MPFYFKSFKADRNGYEGKGLGTDTKVWTLREHEGMEYAILALREFPVRAPVRRKTDTALPRPPYA
jgi:hypothetical protein